MTPGEAALTFVSLAVIVDPVALAPVFGALTHGMPEARVRRTAAVAVLAGFALIGAAGISGHALLRAIGAEIALVRLIVGAALLTMGALMLFGRVGVARLGGAARRDPALFPLAAPLIAGPGALGAMVMFAGKYAGDPASLAELYALLAAVAALTYATFRASGPVTRRLGARGVGIVTRVLGAVLIGAAAHFLAEGLRDYGLVGGRGAAA